MVDLANLVIGTAWAQNASPPPASTGGVLMQYLPLFLIFVVFYFLLIRPQQKKLKAQEAMLKALKKGDKVITSGGFVGTITKLDGDDYVMVEIADGVQVKVVRSTVAGLVEEKKAS